MASIDTFTIDGSSGDIRKTLAGEELEIAWTSTDNNSVTIYDSNGEKLSFDGSTALETNSSSYSFTPHIRPVCTANYTIKGDVAGEKSILVMVGYDPAEFVLRSSKLEPRCG